MINNNSDTHTEGPPDGFFNSFSAEIERRSKAWGPTGASDDYLIATLQSMESSRRILVEDAQRMLTLILALFVAFGALIAFVASGENKTDQLELPLYAAALVLLITIPLLSKLSVQKVTAAYEFYAASALHAYLAHRSRGLHESHQWMARVDRLASSLDKTKENNSIKLADFHATLIEEWIRQPGLKESSTQPNLFQIYTPILGLTGVVAIMGSYLTLLFGVMDVPLVSDFMREAGWMTGAFVLILTFLSVVISCAFYASLQRKFTWGNYLKKVGNKFPSTQITTPLKPNNPECRDHKVL